MSKKVLFVITNHDELGNTGLKTGFWTEELAAPYYTLTDKGVEITLASPKGGLPPIDPKSEDPASQTDATRRMDSDDVLKDKLQNTHKLSEVKSEDFDAVFYPGGHGPLWDLAEDKVSQQLIVDFYTTGKPVGFVCHAPGVLKDVKINDEYLKRNKNVTGFTNTEEEAVQLTDVVPFLVEDMLKKNGGVYSKIEDWNPYAIVDGNLITGQNPASSEKVAEELLQLL